MIQDQLPGIVLETNSVLNVEDISQPMRILNLTIVTIRKDAYRYQEAHMQKHREKVLEIFGFNLKFRYKL